MSNLVLVMGESGSGKSTSIKGLDPKETIVFNILGKRLPFKGSASQYNTANNNVFKIDSWTDIINYIQQISTNAPNIKNIVMDDFTYAMRIENFNRCEEKGYDKFISMADHFRKIIATATSQREDLNVFILMHTEPVVDDNKLVGYKTSTIGKMVEQTYKPEENVTITLFCMPKFNDKGVPEFGFWTHKLKVKGVELPAKTPDGMFEKDFIPNDLGEVVKAMNDYYYG